MEQSPIIRWLNANKDSASFRNSLQKLLSFACAEWLLRGKNEVISPEQAISLFLAANLEEYPLGEWMEAPETHLDEIARFCEAVKTLPLPESLQNDFPGILDLRGIKCPNNAARSRLVMAGVPEGFRLTIYLDDGSPIENVPSSLVADGHIVEKREKMDGFWKLTVVKRPSSV